MRRKTREYESVEAYFQRQMKNPRFRREWKRTEAEMALATELIRLRTQHGFTQAQVAEMVKTSQSSLSRLERHPPKRTTPLLQRLARLYGREVRVEVRLVPSASRLTSSASRGRDAT